MVFSRTPNGHQNISKDLRKDNFELLEAWIKIEYNDDKKYPADFIFIEEAIL